MATPPISTRADAIHPSPTIAVSGRAMALKAQGKAVINLGAGEPDFPTPDHIKEAAIAAIHKNHTRYTQVDGTPELKQAIVDKFDRENKLTYGHSQVLVSAGAKHSIFNALMAILNKGSEVIIPAPYWVSYPDMVLLAGARPVIAATLARDGFKLNAEQLRGAISEKSRLLILNSPGNPTGSCYRADELQALAEVLLDHPQLWVLSDDIYEHILWSAAGFCNLINVCPELADRSIVINGVSKAYAMTGWRIGYAAGPEPLIAAMKKIQSQSTSNPCSISQAAAIAALNGSQSCLEPMVDAFRERAEFVTARLNRIPGIDCRHPDGTFYAFADCRSLIDTLDNVADDSQLAAMILDQQLVALVPGSAFGAPGYLRISYATDLPSLETAMDRLDSLFY